jgi:hypothetical protein
VQPRASRLARWPPCSARHVGHGELGRCSPAPPGSPAGPRAARATSDTGAGPVQPARLQARLLGPCSARHVGHGELGRCSSRGLPGSPAGPRAARAALNTGRCWAPCSPHASGRACEARTARATSDTGSWARARHVGHGELGPRAPPGGPAGPGAARRYGGHGELGRCSPAPPGGPARPVQSAPRRTWELGRCSPSASRLACWGIPLTL